MNSAFSSLSAAHYVAQDLSYKDKHWHEACFKCCDCQASLVDQPFASKDEKLYCADCHDNNFAARCDGCGNIFRAGECPPQRAMTSSLVTCCVECSSVSQISARSYLNKCCCTHIHTLTPLSNVSVIIFCLCEYVCISVAVYPYSYFLKVFTTGVFFCFVPVSTTYHYFCNVSVLLSSHHYSSFPFSTFQILIIAGHIQLYPHCLFLLPFNYRINLFLMLHGDSFPHTFPSPTLHLNCYFFQ